MTASSDEERATAAAMADATAGSVEAVVTGLLVLLAGTLLRNLLFAANLRVLPRLLWAVPLLAVHLWAWWRDLGGAGPPRPPPARGARAGGPTPCPARCGGGP
jgi:hypothetical protein